MIGGALKFDPFKAMDLFVSLSSSFLGDSQSQQPSEPSFLAKAEVEPKGVKGIKDREPGTVVVHLAPGRTAENGRPKL